MRGETKRRDVGIKINGKQKGKNEREKVRKKENKGIKKVENI